MTINNINLSTITLDGLNSLNLKNLQAIAKELRVKNWWTMKKAVLVDTVAPLVFELQLKDKHPEKKAPQAKRVAKTEKELENLVTIKELASEFGMRPAKARRILRSAFGLATTDGKTRWEWDKNSEELLRVRAILHDKKTSDR